MIVEQVGIKYCRYTALAQKMDSIKFVFTMFSRAHCLYTQSYKNPSLEIF
jgi:hypothetical protein